MVLNKKVHQNKEKNLISVTKSSLEHNANFYQRIYQKICPFIGPAAIVAFLLVYHGYLSKFSKLHFLELKNKF